MSALNRIIQTTIGGGVGQMRSRSFGSVNTNVAWAALKDHLLNLYRLCKQKDVLICQERYITTSVPNPLGDHARE